jgi:hypothetical protein
MGASVRSTNSADARSGPVSIHERIMWSVRLSSIISMPRPWLDLFDGLDRCAQAAQRVVETRARRPARYTEHVGDLLEGHPR